MQPVFVLVCRLWIDSLLVLPLTRNGLGYKPENTFIQLTEKKMWRSSEQRFLPVNQEAASRSTHNQQQR